MKQAVAKIVAAYVTIGEIPFLVDLVGIFGWLLVRAGGPVPDAVVQNLVEDGIVGAVVPWWIEPMQWLSPYPIVLLAFLLLIIWAKQL